MASRQGCPTSPIDQSASVSPWDRSREKVRPVEVPLPEPFERVRTAKANAKKYGRKKTTTKADRRLRRAARQHVVEDALMPLMVDIMPCSKIPWGHRRYNSYINSEGWKKRRREAIRAAGDACVVCGAITCLQVHHLTYAHLGNEQPQELAVLCEDCHSAFHHKERG